MDKYNGILYVGINGIIDWYLYIISLIDDFVKYRMEIY